MPRHHPQLTTTTQLTTDPEALVAYREVVRRPLDLGPLDAEPSPVGSPAYPFVLAYQSIIDTVTGALATDVDHISAVVHLSQVVALHRPLRGHERLTVTSDVLGARRHPGGMRVAVRSVLHDPGGTPVADLLTGLLLVGATTSGQFGDLPTHPVRAAVTDAVVVSRRIPEALPRRYAEVSGDDSPIHVDPGHARAAGFPDVIVQGVCLLALVCEEAITRFAAAAPDTVCGAGVRFSTPVVPGDVLELRLYPEVGGRVVLFSGRTARGTALKNGWVELVGPQRRDTRVAGPLR
ncbi:MAG: MaoC/PaaZ C-terminal domain-containing protein [Acidimicrobiales bacterium]